MSVMTTFLYSFRSSRRYPFEEVIKSLSGLSSLEDLSLVSIDLETPELAGFSNLKALRLAYPVTTASEGLHGIFARSATLTVLDIDMPPVEKDDGTTGLHDLSTLIPESVSRRQSAHLKDLRVGRHVMLSAKCIPSLQSLTTLKLDWNSATPPAAFWKSLEVAGIYLRTLHVSKFERCIAHYTLSYSGLEELDLAWVGQRMEEDLVLEDEISNHFYHSVVPKHAGSLKTLQIKGTCVGPWCVTQSNMKAITKCSGLRRLAILYFFPRDAGSVSSQSFSMVRMAFSRMLFSFSSGPDISNCRAISFALLPRNFRAFTNCSSNQPASIQNDLVADLQLATIIGLSTENLWTLSNSSSLQQLEDRRRSVSCRTSGRWTVLYREHTDGKRSKSPRRLCNVSPHSGRIFTRPCIPTML